MNRAPDNAARARNGRLRRIAAALLRTLAAGALVAGLASCGGGSYYANEGERLLTTGDTEQGLAKLAEAVRKNPGNDSLRQQYERERNIVVSRNVSEGDLLRGSQQWDAAAGAYQRALKHDPQNMRAKNGLAALDVSRQQNEIIAQARRDASEGRLEQADKALRGLLAQTPGQREARDLLNEIADRQAEMQAQTLPVGLKSQFSQPITLEFRDASLKSVFEVISRSAGINFVFDRDVRSDTKINIFVRDTSLEDVIKLILLTNQLERKLLNDNTVLIYPNTPAKQKEYKELVVRSFYLANGDVKQALNLVKGMVKTPDVFIDEKLNMMVVKDTPDAVRTISSLLRSMDLAEPEVMLDVEVLEIASTKLQDIGIRYPTQVNVGKVVDDAASSLFVIGRDSVVRAFVANPPMVLDLHDETSGAKVLANPRIRVKNKEKAKIHIGDRVPVITTTSTANVGVSSSVSYLDVGLKLDVEPTIYLRDEVAIKVGLEVSNIRGQVGSADKNQTVAYELGTRNASTTLQLRDGETQILAGLISDEDRRKAFKVPGLGEIPVLGHLFRSDSTDRRKTEIVLLITPRIVRSVNNTQVAMRDMPVGTDAAIGTPPLRIAATKAGGVSMSSTGGGQLPGARPLPQIPSPNAQAVPSVPPEQGAAAQRGANAGGPVPGANQNPTPAPSGPSNLLMAAPLSARSGTDIVVSLSLPPGGAATKATAELVYDPLQLEPTNVSPSAPGRVSVRVEGTASARFRVLLAGGRAQVRAENVTGQSEAGEAVNVSGPGPVEISVGQ